MKLKVKESKSLDGRKTHDLSKTILYIIIEDIPNKIVFRKDP